MHLYNSLEKCSSSLIPNIRFTWSENAAIFSIYACGLNIFMHSNDALHYPACIILYALLLLLSMMYSLRVWCCAELCSLAAIDDNVYRMDPLFQLAHFGMFPAATEQPRRLHAEVPNFFTVTIQETVPIFLR